MRFQASARAGIRPVHVLLFASLLTGCASPGPPRSPSLQLPQLVSDLSASRSGDSVLLHFTVPTRTTDGQPLRPSALQGALCRQITTAGPCVPVDTAETSHPLSTPRDPGSQDQVLWTDHLPATLLSGAPRPIAYRVEWRNAAGHSAGPSDPVYTAAGTAPPPIIGFSAQGTRIGIALQWSPAPGSAEVLLERTGSGSRAPGVDWLEAAPGGASVNAMLDTRALEGVPYQYVAVRREKIQVGGRMLDLRSAPSTPVVFTWRDIYPPPAPAELAAIGYITSPGNSATPATSAPPFAVDLVWRPVLDPRLAGYLVFRQALDAASHPVGAKQRLTPDPVLTPGYHDGTALPTVRYRYSVLAIDPKKNQSSPVETILEPSTGP